MRPARRASASPTGSMLATWWVWATLSDRVIDSMSRSMRVSVGSVASSHGRTAGPEGDVMSVGLHGDLDRGVGLVLGVVGVVTSAGPVLGAGPGELLLLPHERRTPHGHPSPAIGIGQRGELEVAPVDRDPPHPVTEVACTKPHDGGPAAAGQA